jgi:hypothetical protein
LAWRLARRAPFLLARYRFPRACERLLDPFLHDEPLGERDYAGLFRYFVEGWRTYRSRAGEAAAYPGLPGCSGRRVDEIDGFARLMPLAAAWCHAGRPPDVSLHGGRSLSLPQEFARGLIAGTDPHGPAYWGDLTPEDSQRIVLADDIALALWMLRDTAWPLLNAGQQANVVRWLSMMEQRPGKDNNWHLFYVLVDRVLYALGHAGRVPSARRRWERIKSFHLGDGWFRDGPAGRVDYYNAWGFHHSLYWIDQIDPGWDRGFVRDSQRRFLAGYRHLIGPRGFPILGRSIPYRMAMPTPLVLGQSLHPDIVSPGEARRALDCTWRYFIQRGAVRHGTVTQGYFGTDPRVVDFYSGPAAPLWSLRSLVAAFARPGEDDFWQAAPEPLPVERQSFDLTFDGPGWRVRGNQRTGAISIEVLANEPGAAPSLERIRRIDLLKNLANGRPLRPKNLAAKYERRHYNSEPPFCE